MATKSTPITEEGLLKLGFEKHKIPFTEDYCFIIKRDSKGDITICLTDDGYYLSKYKLKTMEQVTTAIKVL